MTIRCTTTHPSFLFLLLAVSLVVKSGADPYGSLSPPTTGVAPPPREAVAGKEFPQSYFCNGPGTRCIFREITCPQECPKYKPSGLKTKGCFIDCNAKNCEAVCKSRRPKCDGLGAACYDPRFVGGDGVMFYFRG